MLLKSDTFPHYGYCVNKVYLYTSKTGLNAQSHFLKVNVRLGVNVCHISGRCLLDMSLTAMMQM